MGSPGPESTKSVGGLGTGNSDVLGSFGSWVECLDLGFRVWGLGIKAFWSYFGG